jgi:hypothetical protein
MEWLGMSVAVMKEVVDRGAEGNERSNDTALASQIL